MIGARLSHLNNSEGSSETMNDPSMSCSTKEALGKLHVLGYGGLSLRHWLGSGAGYERHSARRSISGIAVNCIARIGVYNIKGYGMRDNDQGVTHTR